MSAPSKLNMLLPALLTAPLALAAYIAVNTFHHAQVPVGVRNNLWQDGVLARGESRQHQTKLYNTTSHPVHIAQFVSSPGATLSFESRDIPSHGETRVYFSVKPDSKGKVWVCGSDIYLDGYLDPITLKAYGSLVDLSPPVVKTGDLYIGQEKLLSFPLQSRNEKPTHVLETLYDPRSLDITILPAASGAQAQLRILPRSTPGPFAERVTFVTEDPLMPRVTTQIVGQTLPYVVASPEALSLGVFDSPTQATTTLSLRSPYGKPFTIHQITITPSEALQVVGPPQRVADGYDLHLAVKDCMAGASIDAKISVHMAVNGKTEPENVSIPVYGLCMPP
ncbi:MAG TPA: hypothetical protein VKU00_33545 [Chthonomonadaceae bacterium]|nr:hypothetical protein [Chthonomonadaceae bacterium]